MLVDSMIVVEEEKDELLGSGDRNVVLEESVVIKGGGER